MKTLICPISPLRINRNTVRVTGFLMATMIALYGFTGNIAFIVLIVVDYSIRAWTPPAIAPLAGWQNDWSIKLDCRQSCKTKPQNLCSARRLSLCSDHLTALSILPIDQFDCGLDPNGLCAARIADGFLCWLLGLHLCSPTVFYKTLTKRLENARPG